MLYEVIKNQIKYGTMDKKDLQQKVNIFYLVGQLTEEQYMDLENSLKNLVEKTKEEIKEVTQ